MSVPTQPPADLSLPPVIPTIQETLSEFISRPERLRIHQFQNNLRIFPKFPSARDVTPLLNFHEPTIPLTQQVQRDPTTGKILSYEEVETKSIGESAKNSFSLNRPLGPRSEFLRGNSTNYPFWPGGFEQDDLYNNLPEQINKLQISTDNPETNAEDEDETQLFHRLFEKDLLTKPPGFEEGIFVSPGKSTQGQNKTENFEENIAALDFWGAKDKVVREIETDRKVSEAKLSKSEKQLNRLLRGFEPGGLPEEQDEEEPSKPPVLRLAKGSQSLSKLGKLPWAEAVDVTKPMDNFKEKVPDMAFKYDFELDTFQKEAVVRLEEHENVFVAAHTSAGKTAVAEYAIALSQRHMTRTIYTSPIKALSNQKFRDFKDNKQFNSVGLVTGDVQINPSASCLIMTTEILRSMLYNGSDVIRDLEWVIFDEIHYLNNEERGHVWEEVLIMLPQHVSIIMLSATVPNALQFANWVGGIKRKKIYVISTYKRPVPLEHFLYTGSGGKSRNEQFLILDSNGNFLKKGYDDAKEAKQARMSNFQKQFGPRGKDQQRQQQGFNESQEKTMYIGLIGHLKEKDKLPVVIFTFSRNRCDNYAKMMCVVDLCTGAEKAEVHGIFQRSIARLNGSDRNLPQVLLLQEMLKNGVGVHHSGILPILKEIVEILFQKNLVKVLFATETFAMGVNMPARTVVFDQCRKHDGTSFRALNPAEYIQMAGRAGRRGLDDKGTVVILCKAGIPEYNELRSMLTGSAAKLESQFRLTYSMILNLLRVESLSVEDVMKRSFLEAGKSSNIENFKENRKKLIQKMEEMKDVPRNPELMDFYLTVKDYMNMRNPIMESLVTLPGLASILSPGRCILFEAFPKYSPRFGIILKTYATKEESGVRKNYDVLALVNPGEDHVDLIPFLEDQNKIKLTNEKVNRNYQQFLYFAHPHNTKMIPELKKINGSDAYPYHKIIQIHSDQILEICNRQAVRTDESSVRADITKRDMERFRNDVPIPNVRSLLQELFTVTTQELTEPKSTRFINIFDIGIEFKDVSLFRKFEEYHSANQYINSMRPVTIQDRNKFEDEFRPVFEYRRLLDAKEDYDFLLSPESLLLHEEYQSRIEVLKFLGYINDECLVQLKGRVACEMGNQNELLVTEMVLNNILSDCPPEEIAALLSCMVFEAKNVEEPNLPPDFHLAKKVQEIKETARKIGEAQRQFGLKEPVEQYVEQFKFGLVEVVYEWAKGEEFYKIMRLTDVQEGIIVRTIQRLDEMIRDVKDAARIIGDPSLKKKMEEASECIKRDIVFAASLYTQ